MDPRPRCASKAEIRPFYAARCWEVELCLGLVDAWQVSRHHADRHRRCVRLCPRPSHGRSFSVQADQHPGLVMMTLVVAGQGLIRRLFAARGFPT